MTADSARQWSDQYIVGSEVLGLIISVVVSALDNDYFVPLYFVDEPVLSIDTPGPVSGFFIP